MKKLVSVMGMVVLLWCAAAVAKQPHERKNQPGLFDYYALSMSWAPNFCASHSDPGECGPSKQFGFVLHGLWPQYVQGYPQSCSTVSLTPALVAKYGPLFASPSLINHEWPKHGTCSGLAPDQYLELTARLKDGLAIPDDYKRPERPVRVTVADFTKAFKMVNPSLADNGLLPFCSGAGRFLQEVHVCYDKSGNSQTCAASEVKHSLSSCGQSSFLLQSVK